METEVWPNLVIEAKALGIPLALVNARLSARSARRYGRLRRFSGQVLAHSPSWRRRPKRMPGGSAPVARPRSW